MPFSLDNELHIAVEAARAAGHAMMPHYGTVAPEQKADHSPVTEADRAANTAILEVLQRESSIATILSEESKDFAERLTANHLWIVDPLDGTKEFLAQNGEFSVMIGLSVDAKAVLGVVYLPACDVLYGAALGQGAWVERNGERQRLQSVSEQRRALRMIGSRSHHDPLIHQIQSAMGIADIIPCGSVGVKCMRIAEGQADIYVHPVPYLKEWDTCAPEIILREAGGWVGDCMGQPLRYNKPMLTQPDGILACASGVFTSHIAEAVSAPYREKLAS